MKIYIGLNVAPMSGYITVDPLGGEGKVTLDFKNLDSIVDQGECEEIRADHILDNIHGSELYHVISYWVSRLAHGGKIILGGTDMFEACKMVAMGQITNADANKLFYGNEKSSWGVKWGMYECNEIVGILAELGLSIDKKRVDGMNFIVEAHRE